MSDNLEIPSEGAWTFRSKEVADNFDAHVNQQLPFYPLVTRAIAHIARHYITRGGVVYDIGASTGNVGRAISDTLYARGAHLYAIEESEEMAAKYEGPGEILREKAQEVAFQPYDLAIANLVLMFLPPPDVAPLLERLLASRRPGGALVVVEKCLPPEGYEGVIFHRLTLAEKLASGVSPEAIISKELSLAGVQRPLSSSHMRALGGVEFFRYAEFAGWIFSDG